VAGVALGDIDVYSAWQAWHLSHWAVSGGRCMALGDIDVDSAWQAVGDIDWHSAWQAWRLRHWAGFGGALGSQLTPWTPRLFGRRGTWRHRRAFCVAGVALGDIDVYSAWQAWHLWHWAVSGGALGSQLTPWTPRLFLSSAITLRGRRGAWRHRRAFCVAGVAVGDMDLHFAWQVWHWAAWMCGLPGRRDTCARKHKFLSCQRFVPKQPASRG